MKQKYIELQNQLIDKYKVVIVTDSTCRQRTHAHLDGTRRICKWKQINSIVATFDLLHEIGHIMTNHAGMRRVEQEYYATIWAIDICKELNIVIPDKIYNCYQKYINTELSRGIRSNGRNYWSTYNLKDHNTDGLIINPIKDPLPVKIIYKSYIL